MRKTAVEGSGNFYYLGFFSMDPNKSTKASSILPPSNPSHCGWDSIPRPSGQNYFLRELFFFMAEQNNLLSDKRSLDVLSLL